MIFLIMNHIKNILIKGRYSIVIGCAILTEVERQYLLPYSRTYKEVVNKAKQELDYIDPDVDHNGLEIQTLEGFQLDKLKSKTKKQVLEVQNVTDQIGSTVGCTCSILGLGAINYFYHPTLCGFFVASYLIMLQVDFVKSLSVIKYGVQPPWTFKMKDFGYMMATTFAVLTILVLTKAGIARMRQRSLSKAVTVKETQEKKEDEK